MGEKPSEQRGGTTPDEAEAREKGEWGATAAEGVVPAHCLVIEDAPAGVAAAHAGGMRCLAVRRAGQPDAPGLDAADALVDSLEHASVALVDQLLGIAAR